MRKKTSWRKYQSVQPSIVTQSDSEESILIDDQDDLLNEYGSFAHFLTELKPQSLV